MGPTATSRSWPPTRPGPSPRSWSSTRTWPLPRPRPTSFFLLLIHCTAWPDSGSCGTTLFFTTTIPFWSTGTTRAITIRAWSACTWRMASVSVMSFRCRDRLRVVDDHNGSIADGGARQVQRQGGIGCFFESDIAFLGLISPRRRC